ncbi:MAG: alpha/beta hydrolase [Verrucomicrobiota bacterium]
MTPPPAWQSASARATACAAALLATGCAVVERAGIAVLYEKSALPGTQIQADLSYGPAPRQRLDLFLPSGKSGWPVAIFVHGGSWTGGDKGLRVGGADVYGNIGRYLAGQGIGVAVINYRLQPQVGWREQVADVARATRWVHQHIASRGGRPDQLFLFGHSAGAQLAAYTGLNPQALDGTGLPPGTLRGVIAVSGAGLDLMDAGTYALGHRPDYYRGIIDPAKTNQAWQREGSAVSYIRGSSPPFLVMVGGSEEKAMIRQSNRLHEALVGQGVSSTLLEVRGQSHGRIVLTLSRPDKKAGPAAVDFIRRTIGGG